MLHNNWTHSCLGCWDTVTAPSWQRRFYIITVILTGSGYTGSSDVDNTWIQRKIPLPLQVLKPALVARVSTKVQKISREIIISKIFSCQDDNAEEDIDFINMQSQIPFSDDNFFFSFHVVVFQQDD